MNYPVIMPDSGRYFGVGVAEDADDLEFLLATHAAPGMPPLLVPGCWDAMSAGLIEKAGYKAAYLGRDAVARAMLGHTDVELVTARMMILSAAYICEASTLKLIVDAGNGFGNAFNVARTVKTLETSGARAIQIDDDIGGQVAGATGKLTVDMIGKVKAAVDAASDVLLIARTTFLAGEPVEAVADRANAYVEAGADLVMISRPAISDTQRLIEAAKDRIPLAIETDEALEDRVAGVAMISQPLRFQQQVLAAGAGQLTRAAPVVANPDLVLIRSLAN